MDLKINAFILYLQMKQKLN